ncbi:PREDICTED: octopamine receptor Oamb-like isoform X1 [Drosophila arizonae]|uniref:Octopamine receptor Oamb-like isoform X1 n=1 Tax=Drosophila arizonae TaxID=7263 RepID=A0ABM1NMJ2_DROAR|nr:PREDICTED: octopamine receptor Oamb-like isoform X1 [Drosophila arizonae]
MNETECEDLIKSVKWTEPANLISLAILEFINVLVIGGNCLVIAAVFCSNKLRSVTNFFIVNLAVADLLVGLAVLPFSATWEVFKVWIFGDVWCRIWLAVDVWMCTASILNLCAISLDRYVAVTRPVTYPSIMSTKKAKSLIAGIWVLSFVICFPPLVGWKDQKAVVQPTYTRGNYTLYYATTMSSTQDEQLDVDRIKHKEEHDAASSLLTKSGNGNGKGNAYNPYDHNFSPIDDSAEIHIAAMTTTSTISPSTEMDSNILNAPASNVPQPATSCPWKCELTNDRGYVLYSALGSFYIPMFVMLFFYWRIYRAAVRTTRAINQGFKTTKGSPRESGGNNRVDDSQLILRIHRGRPCGTPQRTPLSVHSMSSTLSVNSNGPTGAALSTANEDQQPASQTGTPKRATSMRVNRQRHEKVSIKVSFPSSENMLESPRMGVSQQPPPSPHYAVISSTKGGISNLTNGRRASFKSSLFDIGETTFNLDTASGAANDLESGNSTGLTSGKKRSGKRSAKFQVKRFRMETKAAKTLAIIVGGFIVCWLPFFTMYLIRAFCEDCIQPTVFSVLFWLGYCNSAINPVIYALFSHEFRIAFKRIVCRCVCTRSGFRASENFQMIAARALMAPATFHKTISGCSDDGDGVDFS